MSRGENTLKFAYLSKTILFLESEIDLLKFTFLQANQFYNKSFNSAMYQTAVETLQKQGYEVKTSDLYTMNFNPVSNRNNFTTVRDVSFLKLGQEEIYATENDGFAIDIKIEQENSNGAT